MLPTILWQPTQNELANTNLAHYFKWLGEHRDYHFSVDNYQSAWEWSVRDPARFWESLVQYFDLKWEYSAVLSGVMPRVKWFEGAKLNYAEEIFRRANDNYPAILFVSEHNSCTEITWHQLRNQVASVANYLADCGINAGDRVVGYLPNRPEATVAMLATISLGAIWSSASPDFGAESVIERFAQIEPKILFATVGYTYGGKWFDRMDVVSALQDNLPTLKQTIVVENTLFREAASPTRSDAYITWEQIENYPGATSELNFTRVPFDHPLWILFSSGTTGMPKAITHGHGGMLLEHLKYLTFHNDIHPGERFFWYTTTGWMMWNFTHAALLAGATIVLYDGSPGYPTIDRLWDLAKDLAINHFGIGAAFILSSMKARVSLAPDTLPALRCMGVTGSPLPPEGFEWIYQHIKPDVWLSSMSGGTDVCTAWVGGNPLLPVYKGEIQCRCLGCAMESYDENGTPQVGVVGEMVITQPMPCMPVRFWNDPDGTRYFNSYFEEYPGIWRHGDWVLITERNTVVILGRSDATLNRQGIRIGTSEIYRSVEKLLEIQDSLIVDLPQADGTSFMPLFVVLAKEIELTDTLKKRILQTLRSDFSPRHVPDSIIEVPEIPYTISGKKIEIPVKKLLMGKSLEKSVNMGAVRNPDAILHFLKISPFTKL